MAARPAILIRLSREDTSSPGSLDAKIERHLSMARELCERYGLPPVPASDLYIEGRVSGKRLSARPQTRKLLEACAEGVYSHLVTPYQDRLLRGDKRDEADIEDALIEGNVTLVTTEGIVKFDDDYESRDALSFEVRALAGRHFLRDLIKKMKEANRRRHADGRRSQGFAPYGYVWITDQRDPITRQVTDPAHYEIRGDVNLADPEAARLFASTCKQAEHCLVDGVLDQARYLALARRWSPAAGELLPGVTVQDGEYFHLCSIWEWAPDKGIEWIAARLNEGGVPTSGTLRTSRAAAHWQKASVHNLLENSFYAGYPMHRYTVGRNGKARRLTREQVTLSDTEQSYPHPISLTRFEEIRALISARNARGHSRASEPYLLTGLLQCAADQPFRASSDKQYRCPCGLLGNPHRGQTVQREHVETVVLSVLQQILDALPAGSTPLMTAGNTRPDAPLLDAARKRFQEAQKAVRDLDQSRPTFERAGLGEAWLTAKASAEQEREEAEQQYNELRAQRAEIDIEEVGPILAALREYGFQNIWDRATASERRLFLRAFFRRIVLLEPEADARQSRTITVELHPFLMAYQPDAPIEFRQFIPHHRTGKPWPGRKSKGDTV